ncbi:uncharacterized protein LOC123399060 [Hordeum vulgare subsp. vulgare]|uniref:uncharacterized protein LOC123399060 n=1 Tax=Hordeum vulgare subsp. vulgare TaxID=112509 RepID=UPI001D1A5597|nr:uncharacterized protein LOC123399060 [Hordeum vulgare subsp. vulgare]
MEHCTNDPLPITLCKGGLGSHDELNHDSEENQSNNKELTTKHTRMLPRLIPLRMRAESLQGKRKEQTPSEQDAKSIYSSGCLHELTLAILGCIEIEVQASKGNAFANEQRFYKDILNTIYHALENACQTAITDLKNTCRVQVDDPNYTGVVAQ